MALANPFVAGVALHQRDRELAQQDEQLALSREDLDRQMAGALIEVLRETEATALAARRRGAIDDAILNSIYDRSLEALQPHERLAKVGGMSDLFDAFQARMETSRQVALATKPIADTLLPAFLQAGFGMDEAKAYTAVGNSGDEGLKQALGVLSERAKRPEFIKTAEAVGLSPDETKQLFIQSKQPAQTTIKIPAQYPTAPEGWHYDGDFSKPETVRLIPTPGGPAEAAIRDAATQKEAEVQGAGNEAVSALLPALDRIEEFVSRPEYSRRVAAFTPDILAPDDLAQLRSDAATIKSQMTFEKLSRIPSLKPISEDELRQVAASAGSIDLERDSPKVILEKIARARDIFKAAAEKAGVAPSGGGLPMIQDQAAYDALPAGTQYRTAPGGEVYTKRAN